MTCRSPSPAPSRISSRSPSIPGRSLALLSRFVLQPAARCYLRRERTYRGHGLTLQVPSGVFHPGLFFSSGVMAGWLSSQDLTDRSLLDVGTGSGLLGLVAARGGARVTLLDLSPRALLTAAANAQGNRLRVRLVHSDGLRNLPADARFDWIVANPPWFPSAPNHEAGLAWYAGPRLDWFSGFFAKLSQHLSPGGRAVLVLSDSADLSAIGALAGEQGWRLVVLHRERVLWEGQTLLQVVAT